MSAAAFKATYSDFKIIRGRKVCQIVLEVSLEAGDAALAALGGVPRPDAETWVGVARIDPDAGKSQPKAIDGPSEHERRKWAQLPFKQQAAMRCNEAAFSRFCQEKDGPTFYEAYADPMATEEKATAAVVREFCGVKSRADILDGTRASERWQELEADYQLWRRRL